MLALGRLHHNKAFDVAIRALVDLPGAVLWIAGKGPERNALQMLANQLGVSKRIRWLGWRDDVAALFASADVLVCPSRIEPLGNVIIEAWAQRLSESSGGELLAIARRIEEVMQREKGLFPNLDFYSAVVFDQLGIEQRLFTPVFVIARLTGWAAHIIEPLGDNKLIRPTSEYIGPDERPFVPLAAR